MENEQENKLKQAFEQDRQASTQAQLASTGAAIHKAEALNWPLRGGQYFLIRYVDSIAHEWGPFTPEAALQTLAQRGNVYSLVCRHGRDTPVA